MLLVSFREFHIPLLIIATIIGYQISCYCFYQYSKNKRFSFDLNKLFLALGLFSLLVLTALVFRIYNNYYINEIPLLILTRKIIIFLIIFAGIVFLLIMLSNTSSEILNQRIAKIIIFLNIISTIILIFIDVESIWITIILIPNSIALIFIFYIQLQFLKKSMGQIKSRFKKILLGEFLFGIALGFGSEETVISILFDKETLFLFTIFTAIIGLLIVFVGVFRFPVFFEFGWTSQLLRLFIIDQQNLRGIYFYDFLEGRKNERQDANKDQVYSKGIIGIETVIGLFMNTNFAEIEKIEHGDRTIFLKHGDLPYNFLTYVLIVKSNMKTISYFLDVIKQKFQSFYGVLLSNLDDIKGNEEQIFAGFDNFILNLIK